MANRTDAPLPAAPDPLRPSAVLLGPLGLPGTRARLAGLALVVVATVLTQVGGAVLWPWFAPAARVTRRAPGRWRFPAGILVLAAGWVVTGQLAAPLVARLAGRVPLPLVATAEVPLGPRSLVYPLLLRSYVRPAVRDALVDAAREVAAAHPGAVVRYLDAGFPLPGLPLLPHLSHGDGRKVDVALLFERDGAPVDGTPSPLGYWGFAVPPGPDGARLAADRDAACAGALAEVPVLGPTRLRWDLPWLQPAWPALALDVDRTGALVRALSADERVTRMLLEPTLHAAVGAPKVRANPCAVARHDDHLHVEVR